MSVGAIVHPSPPTSKIPRSNPCVNLYLSQRNKITKGFHLASPRKPSRDLPGEPLQGTPLLSRENSQVYGHYNTPRQDFEESNLLDEFVVNPHTECEETFSLSLCGERLGKASSRDHQQPSLPLIRTRVRSDVRELHQTHCDVTREGTTRSKLTNSSTSPECMFRGNLTPLVPPSSPLTPGVDQSFAVDGRHINCDGASRSPSIKDFNPGFIKRPRYCCGKCELRMLEHESLNIETECPFQAYQRQTKSSLCYANTLMSRDIYGEPDIDPYVFYESPWNDYSVSGRSKSVPATTWTIHADSKRMCSRNEMNEKIAVSESISCSTNSSHSSEDLNDEANTALPSAPERDALLNGGSNGRPSSPVQGASHGVIYNRNPIYTVPRLEDVDHQYRKASGGVLDDRQLHVERVGIHGTEDRVFQWRDSWNVRETRFASPDTSLYNQESPLENSRTSLPIVSGRPTPSEMTSSLGYREDELILPQVPVSELHSSEDLHGLLQGCVNSFKNISLITKELEGASALDNSDFLSVDTINGNTIYVPLYTYMYNHVGIVGNPRVILIDSLFHVGEKACGLRPMVCDDAMLVAIPKQIKSWIFQKLLHNRGPTYLRMPRDVCYQPVTDKRYNRWKRTKKKGKGGKFSLVSDESDEESTDEREKRSPSRNRRRRRKLSDDSGPKFEFSSNDASSEPQSDLMTDSVVSRHYNSPMPASTEPDQVQEQDIHAASYERPNRASDDDEIPGVLTSFPALNSYHASIHGVNTDFRIHGSTPELASTRPTPCDATPIVFSTCSSPEERISDGLNAKSRKSPEIEVPLVSKEDLSTRKSPTISSSLGSSDSYSTIRSNSRFSNSMAKDTLVRMSYSIGEKIIKSMAVVPVTYGRKDIDVFKKKDPPRQHTPQTTPKPASGSASKSRIDPRSKALRNIGIGFGFKYPIPNPEPDHPQLSTLTLNHLLQTMPSKESHSSSGLNKSAASVAKNSETNAVATSKKNQLYPKKKNFGIQRKICLVSKFPEVRKKNEKKNMNLESEVQSSPQLNLIAPRISNLDFTPAFTYSMFELPDAYRNHNTMLQRRASGFK